MLFPRILRWGPHTTERAQGQAATNVREVLDAHTADALAQAMNAQRRVKPRPILLEALPVRITK